MPGGERLRSLLRRSLWWVLAAVFAVVYGAVVLGLDLLRGEAPTAGRITGSAVGAVLVAGAWVVVWRRAMGRARKAPPGSPTGAALQRAVRTGIVPEKAVADEWIPVLRKVLRQERWMQWIGPLLFGAFAVLGGYLAADDPAHPWFGWLCIASFGGIGLWYLVWIPKRRIRIEVLIQGFSKARKRG